MPPPASGNLPKQFIMKGGEKMPFEQGVDHCLRCGKPVDLSSAVVLELDQVMAEWHDFGMPDNRSDGFDLFGADCAEAMRTRAKHFGSDMEVQPKDVVLKMMSQRLKQSLTKPSSETLRLHWEAMLRLVEAQLARLGEAQ